MNDPNNHPRIVKPKSPCLVEINPDFLYLPKLPNLKNDIIQVLLEYIPKARAYLNDNTLYSHPNPLAHFKRQRKEDLVHDYWDLFQKLETHHQEIIREGKEGSKKIGKKSVEQSNEPESESGSEGAESEPESETKGDGDAGGENETTLKDEILATKKRKKEEMEALESEDEDEDEDYDSDETFDNRRDTELNDNKKRKLWLSMYQFFRFNRSGRRGGYGNFPYHLAAYLYCRNSTGLGNKFNPTNPKSYCLYRYKEEEKQIRCFGRNILGMTKEDIPEFMNVGNCASFKRAMKKRYEKGKVIEPDPEYIRCKEKLEIKCF